MKREFKSGRAASRAERRSVRLEIREAILDQRALRLEIKEEALALREELEATRRQITAAYIDSLFEPYGKRVYNADSADCQTCPHKLICKDACLYDLYPDGTIETNPNWKEQYNREYWEWVDAMEEEFEREWEDDFDDVGERDRDPFHEEIAYE